MKNLEPGILKSVDSIVNAHYRSDSPLYFIKYKGKRLGGDLSNVRLFFTIGAAKSKITALVTEMFTQGEYIQSCAAQIKKRSGYDVDFSATIAILPQYGLTSRFQEPGNKKMLKQIATQLLEAQIFTIEEI